MIGNILKALMTAALISGVAAAGANEKEPDKLKSLAPADKALFSCEGFLINNVKLLPSGREGESFNTFAEIVKKYVEPNGIFDQLGISIPRQVLKFMPGADVNSVGNVNGYPIAHWYDGKRIAQVDRGGLLYEIVISGETEHWGFYRDDNSLEEQFSIFLHASAGHQHFSHNSRYPHFRSSDRIQESIDLSLYMDKLRNDIDPDEVSLWYQYLLSLQSGQDYINAVYERPEDLKIQPARRTARGMEERPLPETRNIFQAFVGNLPVDTPEWKVEMAKRFERLHRFGAGMARTKIVNEGWSTFMQILLPKHAGLNSFKESVHYCCLLHGVTRKSLSNPYWLGLEAWKNIYARFLKRPNIQALPDFMAKDKAFIAYATRDIIGVMDDEMFLKYGLDDNWIVKENLALTRPYTQDELFEAGLEPPDPKDPNAIWPYSILTRDPKKIIRSIVMQEKGFFYKFPAPYVTNWNDNGQIALEMKDPVGRKIGFEPGAAVETLFILAQIQARPVSIEATFDDLTPAPEELPNDEEDEDDWDWRPEPVWVKKRYKLVVFPDGKVETFEVFRNGSSAPESLPENDLVYDHKVHKPTYKADPESAKQLEEVIKRYLYNLTIGHPIQRELFAPEKTLKTADDSIEAIISGVPLSLQLSIPTAPRALTEYNNFLAKRLDAILKDAILGKAGIIRRPDGVRLKTMPDIPWFQFDRQSMQREIEAIPNLPIPRQVLQRESMRMGAVFQPGDFSDVRPVGGQPGDVIWGPDPNGGGGGKGDQPGGDDPSEDGGERQFEPVSLDDYADALAEEVWLPNLRPKKGLDNSKDDEVSGPRTSQSGMPMNRIIMRKAFKRGYPTPEEIKNGADPMAGSDLIRRGLGRMRKEVDWTVRNYEPKPSPDMSAVVFFQMDMSGSMGRFKKTAKQILFDLRAVLMKRYKNIKFVYIAFNDKAHVFNDPDEFFRFSPNGGTRYAHSFNKTVELYAQYPEAQYDRFPVIVGDLDETNGEAEHSAFEEMKNGASFVTTFRTHDFLGGWDDLANWLKRQSEEDEYVGYVDVIPASSYAPYMLGQGFKNVKDDK